MDVPRRTPAPPDAPGAGASQAAGLRLLPSPVRLEGYELRGVIAEGNAATVYLGADLALRVPVAIREYMPPGLAWRDAAFRVMPLSPEHATSYIQGLQAFIDEARMLARCDHPSLLRIVRLLEANGTAYCVMPHYVGRHLADVGRDAGARFNEDRLRALLDDLLGAIEAFHVYGVAHGGVAPDNILLLQNGRPLLLRPRARSQDGSGARGDTLTGYLQVGGKPQAGFAGVPAPAATLMDLHDVARVIRFLMAAPPLADEARAEDGRSSSTPGTYVASPSRQQAHCSRSFLDAIDAAASPLPQRRPRSVGEFREWLTRPATPEPVVVSGGSSWQQGAWPAEDAPVPTQPADDLGAAAGFAETPERSDPGFGAAPAWAPPPHPHRDPMIEPSRETPAASPPVPPRDAHAESAAVEETIQPAIAAGALIDQDRRPGQVALKSAVALGLLTLVAAGTWLLYRPTVSIQGWSKGLAPTSLTPSRSAASAVAAAGSPPREAMLSSGSPAASSATLPVESSATSSTKSAAAAVLPAPRDTAALSQPMDAPTTGAPQTAAAFPPTRDATAPTRPPGDAALLPQRSEPVLSAPRETAPSGPGNDFGIGAPDASQRPRSAASPAPVRPALPQAGSPRERCAPRTQFALYRCMQTQCRDPKWSRHAQCLRLRDTDQVD